MLPRAPVVFGPAHRPLTGFFHPPDGGAARPLAVVLCSPLGYEAMSVHRTYRHLAEHLAAQGIAALRFDHDGTGDSPVPSGDPDRVATWVAGIRAAVAEARTRAGVERVAVFGVGVGATLAAAAAPGLSLDALVLWAPVVSGRAHVRELRAFRLFKYSKAGPPPRSDGSEEIAGYLFDRETLADLAALDMLAGGEQLAGVEPLARRALVVTRGERPGEELQLVERLKKSGTDAQLLTDSGHARMMRDDPYDTIIPFATLEAIAAWLAEDIPPQPRTIAAGTSPAPVEVLLPDGEKLRETPLTFGDNNRLFGVLTEPAAPSDRPAIFFLNVGGNHHVGPHRMNVELARELAARGHVTFRFDASGLGDSGAAPGQGENRIYALDAVADVQAAMGLVAARLGLRRFVLVGLCSGAYLAFHGAAADARVVGQVLLSPYAFEWKEGDPVTPTERKDVRDYRSTRFYAKALLDPGAWRLAIQGKVDLRGIAGALLERAQDQVEGLVPALGARLRRQQRPHSEVERTFRALADRGVATYVVLGFEDGGLDTIARYLGRDASRMRGRANFALEILEGVDHTFTTLDSQAKLRALLQHYFATRFS